MSVLGFFFFAPSSAATFRLEGGFRGGGGVKLGERAFHKLVILAAGRGKDGEVDDEGESGEGEVCAVVPTVMDGASPDDMVMGDEGVIYTNER